MRVDYISFLDLVLDFFHLSGTYFPFTHKGQPVFLSSYKWLGKPYQFHLRDVSLLLHSDVGSGHLSRRAGSATSLHKLEEYILTMF
jgi:hypothetical protein